jgi:hypothetical protein
VDVFHRRAFISRAIDCGYTLAGAIGLPDAGVSSSGRYTLYVGLLPGGEQALLKIDTPLVTR